MRVEVILKEIRIFAYVIIQLFIFNTNTAFCQYEMASTYQRAAELCEAAAKKYDALNCSQSAAYCRKMSGWNNCMVRQLGSNPGSCGPQPLPENAPKCDAAMIGGAGATNNYNSLSSSVSSGNAQSLQQQQNLSQQINDYTVTHRQENIERQKDQEKIARQGSELGKSIQGNIPDINKITGQNLNDKSVFGSVPTYEDVLKANNTKDETLDLHSPEKDERNQIQNAKKIKYDSFNDKKGSTDIAEQESNTSPAKSNNSKSNGSSLKYSTTLALSTFSCEELIHYRDVDLVTQFDNVTKKYSYKYKLDNDAIEDIKKQKVDLLNKRGWDELMSTGIAMSEGGVKIAQIAKIVQTGCNLIFHLAEALPGEGEIASEITEGILSAENIKKYIETGKDIKEILNGKLDEVGYAAVLAKMGPLGKIAKAGWKFSQDLYELSFISEEGENLKKDVERILDMQEDAIFKYQNDLENNKELLNQKIQIINGITKYLLEQHCESKKANVEAKNLPKNELAKKTKTPVIVQDKEVTSNEFYIFLTMNIEIKPKASQFSNLQSPKTIFIISKPLLHKGNLTDDMQVEKELFITNVEKHFINEPDEIKKIRKKEMEIHYGKPYSTEVSKTSTEGYGAIEAYKASIKEALEGLAQFDFLGL